MNATAWLFLGSLVILIALMLAAALLRTPHIRPAPLSAVLGVTAGGIAALFVGASRQEHANREAGE